MEGKGAPHLWGVDEAALSFTLNLPADCARSWAFPLVGGLSYVEFVNHAGLLQEVHVEALQLLHDEDAELP